MRNARKKLADRPASAPKSPRPAPKPKSRLSAPREDASIADMVESIIGCKWSLHVLSQVRQGVHRPGELARSAEGLSSKVLSERLDKMVRFGLLARTSFPQAPPHVEYRFTPLGERFLRIIDEVDRVQRELRELSKIGV
jgi:DNA-binding HxlR family transcriptional regulator